MAAVAGALYGVTATNCYFPHYYVLGESGLVFFFVVGVDALGSGLSRVKPSMRFWARSIALLAVVLPLEPRVEALSGQSLKDPAPFADPVPGVLDFIRKNSAPTDRIFTSGPPGLYVAADRRPATDGSPVLDELLPAMPGDTDTEKLQPFYTQLSRVRPKIVFLDPEIIGVIRVGANRKRRYMATAIMPFLAEYKYVKVTDYLYKRP